ncbi:nickel pincer cofactor biosynthesis protein LarC [Blastopirellula marina]|uniref:Putative nickel insertion protein n=1 Tax=Blastopirellula marina TaxID=124 RepID=A0A2S8FFE5_9BACT|nr:nickel pincer cofactor biosynthesis protein LarC [Blastopirellula marina]PQO30889.1 nickel pincer cofactor biosynthesis protein LarC [Blastopirellula marina]PTL42742.1 nickel pincer cofactor biosynthesis protein LarC [Blastopirellula marina]
MKIAYLDCPSGIAGDMTLAAMIDAGVPLELLQQGIASLGLPGVRLAVEEVKRHGFRALHLTVEHEPEHAHRHLHHIDAMIDAGDLTAAQKELAKRIFLKVGEAEAKVHGSTLQKVHFHEVGAVDSIADIVGAAIGWDYLGVDRIVCSPVPTGTGYIEIAHGRCSVPAPATAEILKGIPLAASDVPFELTTPTGAAIVATIVDQFGPLPAMQIDRIGYGAGTRELKSQANIIRLILGETADPLDSDQVWVVETNLDDISGEVIGHASNLLLEKGALDVYSTSIQMKKNRPGVQLTVLCDAADLAKMERILFRETGTLGVRRFPVSRHKLVRREHAVETAFGAVAGKLAWIEGGPASFSPEYEACRVLAAKHDKPLREIYDAAQAAFDPNSL